MTFDPLKRLEELKLENDELRKILLEVAPHKKISPEYTQVSDDIETRLRQSKKLEELGSLAGGIAHEINSPIQYISDNLHFLKDAFENLMSVLDAQKSVVQAADVLGVTKVLIEASEKAESLADIEFLREELPQAISQSIYGTRQVADIMLAMKEFYHPGTKQKAAVDLNRILERASLICRSEWKSVATIEFDLDPDLPELFAHEGELNQVALNLFVNATHAIEAKKAGIGRITVRTSCRNQTLFLEVKDNGTGIPQESLERIFEPYFTTKEVGKGTGQGLSLCQDIIVKNHNGQISVESVADEGTSFFVSLPLIVN